MEDYAYILDYLPQGHMDDKRYHRQPTAFGLGDHEFKLLELTPKEGSSLLTEDRVYIGKDTDKREKILHVKRRVHYDDLTHAAQGELPFIIMKIVHTQEERFVKFFNDAQAITTRFHMLELLPGLGKKSMWAILEERKKSKYTSFQDIEERSGVRHPDKLIAKRIETEISDPHQKYHLFVTK